MMPRCLLLSLVACVVPMTVSCANRSPAPPAQQLPATLRDAPFLTTNGDRWKLLWHDEFTGTSLDASKWKIGLPWRGTDGDGRHHNNQYASYIADHNVVVESGVLKLLTRREDITARNLRKFHYTEGLITTAHAFRHRYGYWEARVKIPVDAGPGLWPAFWTLSEGWPPEMDICEVWTSSSKSHQGLCYRPSGGGKERWDDHTTRDPLPRGWTTYGMEWGPGYQVYNIDGRVTKRVYGDHVPDNEHYVLLNSGVESTRPPTDQTIFPNAFEVDYVRVYDRSDEPAMLHNGDLENEDGYHPWQRKGVITRSGTDAHGGRFALRVEGPGAAEQKVYGLQPSTTYMVRAWAKALAGEAVLSAADAEVRSARQDYRELRVEFTTGPDATTAVIRCGVAGDEGTAVFDDLSITARPSPARPDN